MDLPGVWRPPLQGIECGAGTESDDATATVGASNCLFVQLCSSKE
ncbi:hypothetical protein FOXG_19171 [Fusarium oxysporum f. sp. lycopersici 4287]|uniref:Uncharacterized protein n=2 Tax=Fusarium oxysporum TaxID=5507 RepID=A0A0J9UWT8_FUSO4|nr:hypothetical protein FOXG_19171 [Fusarium oxysporum f. sp. lycopersici 4287]EXK33206.1 hypothetical protein FOMG_11954 [Fusarium oxysporum f. sp. melonis 26406]KNB03625.1 hypothetical protein FOXG_19171 [Fusarium oxysporum f. sp. lycopersici 4287]